MAQNTAVVEKKKNEIVYVSGGEEVRLTPDTIKKYLVSGDPAKVSMEEIVMFGNLCKYNRLNPWLKEAYCIKYGNSPATMVVSKEAEMKRAEDSQQYDGREAGVIVLDEDGEVVYRVGEFKLPGDKILGGWAEVYRKDMSHPFRAEVSFEEYCGRTKDGKPNSQWASKPATMIRKVALVHALREAFPKNIGGMVSDDEVNKGTIDIVVEERKAIAEAQSMMGSGGAIDIPAEVIEEPAAETAPDPGF